MSDPRSPAPTQEGTLEAVVPHNGPDDASLRLRLKSTRDQLIHEAATRMIRLGQKAPKLRQAGYWLYGAATRYWPMGKDVDKLGPVGETVLRGAQPSLKAFEGLKEMGVTTVINLRPESDYERKVVEQLGMKYYYMPLPPLDKPTHALTIAFLRAVTDPANGMVFFHCFHGVDRTGTMAACLRIARDDWGVEEALTEMRAYKVHESGQRAKVVYLQEFADHWAALSEHARCEILHRPLPAAPTPEPAPIGPWWARATRWVQDKLGGLWREDRA
jgi:protein tyrosine phosphatase (PTP) superfamily phosphohydrolase (DUF442 family)